MTFEHPDTIMAKRFQLFMVRGSVQHEHGFTQTDCVIHMVLAPCPHRERTQRADAPNGSPAYDNAPEQYQRYSCK